MFLRSNHSLLINFMPCIYSFLVFIDFYLTSLTKF